MLSSTQKSIILRAVKIRMQKGEGLEDVLASYPKLAEEDKVELVRMLPDGWQHLVAHIRQRVSAGEDLKTVIAALGLTDGEKWKLEAEVKEGQHGV